MMMERNTATVNAESVNNTLSIIIIIVVVIVIVVVVTKPVVVYFPAQDFFKTC